MDTVSNVIYSVNILPASTKQTLGRSVLPDRFVSDSRSQQGEIVGAGLGSTIGLSHQIGDVVVPATVA